MENQSAYSLNAYLEKQPTETLSVLLRQELDKSPLCPQTIMAIWSVLEARHRQNQTEVTEDMRKAWDAYCKALESGAK